MRLLKNMRFISIYTRLYGMWRFLANDLYTLETLTIADLHRFESAQLTPTWHQDGKDAHSWDQSTQTVRLNGVVEISSPY